MQSFILDRHTDPSNPTMKVTQDDKIPVYDSKAAAEADIANIADDGIVFTKDTGATEKVVDVVQDGNMNPVTSNAVADEISSKNRFYAAVGGNISTSAMVISLGLTFPLYFRIDFISSDGTKSGMVLCYKASLSSNTNIIQTNGSSAAINFNVNTDIIVARDSSTNLSGYYLATVLKK